MLAQPELVIICGPFRSGTSLTAALCDRMGVHFGPEEEFSPPADRYNPTGYFQRSDVVGVNQMILDYMPDSLDRDIPLPPELPSEIAERLVGLDLGWLEGQGISGLKDPRFSLTLPAWLAAAPWGEQKIRVVRVHRNIESAASSAARHHAVGKFCDYDFAQAKVLTERLDSAARQVCLNRSVAAHVVDFDRLIRRPYEEVQGLAGFLGGDRKAAARAAALVGKKGSLARHYGRKLLHPRRVWDTTRKTMRAYTRRGI